MNESDLAQQFMSTKPTYEELEKRVWELDLLRQRHGIEFASDPVKLDEGQACTEIARLWRDEQCQSAFVVLRQFVATHQGANGEWAAHMVEAANRKRAEAEKDTQRIDWLEAMTPNIMALATATPGVVEWEIAELYRSAKLRDAIDEGIADTRS